MKLASKVAIVTGAASGIGAAIAERFRSEGAMVVSADLEAIPGPEIHKMDVSVEEGWVSLILEVLGRHGRVDILVNAAGISLNEDTVEACTPETLARTFAVNLDGMFLGCKHVIAPMRRQGNGSIINIGSILGRVADGASAAYTASKGGVGMLTKSTALHLARTALGVRCNQVSPTYTLTPMMERWLAELPAGNRRALETAHPLGRLGRPQEIAAAALFLASDESQAITGADFLVDGGYTAQ
ncbi:SDR family oxidoreductase [Phyllobacterium sophorae]|uniref:3-beta hydroxysteroid dehydrogenase n=1 Tax=Phyllobacterium sophorae TaxID=1520277 RepID=A0A2P7AMX7_9HYPH|nr:SDR family oxidoreductase [Phyllobacterium sophorae]PSH55569.1 3-beta hydroxysteroid dehydrogenase [Phyllobacterium sophorae]